MLEQDRRPTFSQGAVHVTFRFPRGRIKAVALWEQPLCSREANLQRVSIAGGHRYEAGRPNLWVLNVFDR